MKTALKPLEQAIIALAFAVIVTLTVVVLVTPTPRPVQEQSVPVLTQQDIENLTGQHFDQGPAPRLEAPDTH